MLSGHLLLPAERPSNPCIEPKALHAMSPAPTLTLQHQLAGIVGLSCYLLLHEQPPLVSGKHIFTLFLGERWIKLDGRQDHWHDGGQLGAAAAQPRTAAPVLAPLAMPVRCILLPQPETPCYLCHLNCLPACLQRRIGRRLC